MTDQYTTSTYPQTPAETPTATQTAKDETAQLKDKAADAGGRLVDEAKGEAAAVTQEARRQLGDLWSQARSELSDQAGSQQSRLASGLTSVGGQLTQMAAAPSEQNLATDIVREVGDRVDALGGWLESHGPDDVLDEVRSFARRRPGTFLLIAAGAGVVLGRLTRGLKDAPSTSTSTPRTAPVATRRTMSTEPLPVYDDAVERRPRFTDELASPVPGAPATTSWEER
ncbi:hypothetical protein ASD16_04835 [Cellulomonas sp. Root485]|uniref:hypothetical protein n=1 Tax=Cellulomonas sp. Root485 TaxID=1736546 RepID=UPI0006FB8FF4|nr:hypothetical protein [Cellulomonas sp. Root485]KQY24822.1 hypothetical protein ASD16_04835 [Cellulomonas sp. Root485]